MNQKKVFDSYKPVFYHVFPGGIQWVKNILLIFIKQPIDRYEKWKISELLDRITIYTSDMVPLKSFIFQKPTKNIKSKLLERGLILLLT